MTENEIKYTVEQLKHLDYIQNVITRMNSNSFQIKTWTVTILSAFLGLSASTKNDCFILIPIIPTFLFWFLDTYYLTQERRFRGIYNHIIGAIEKEEEELIPIRIFEMPIHKFTKKNNKNLLKKYTFWNVFKSFTIGTLYFSIVLILIVLFYILRNI